MFHYLTQYYYLKWMCKQDSITPCVGVIENSDLQIWILEAWNPLSMTLKLHLPTLWNTNNLVCKKYSILVLDNMKTCLTFKPRKKNIPWMIENSSSWTKVQLFILRILLWKWEVFYKSLTFNEYILHFTFF